MTKTLLLIIPALLTFMFAVQTQDTQSEIERKDREHVLKMFKKIYGPGGQSRAEQVAKRPKFFKRPDPEKAIPDEWHVEFVYLVTSETGNFEEERDRILTLYGGELMDSKSCTKRICGFWIKAPDYVAERISTDQMVRRVEQNGFEKAILDWMPPPSPPPTPKPKSVRPKPNSFEPTASRSTNDYNLDRIDTRARFYDSLYNYNNLGPNGAIYVLDTGIANHPEFGTRIKRGSDATFDPYASSRPAGVFDCVGHGTAVASVAAGATTGVASENQNIVPVVALRCDGAVIYATLESQLNGLGTFISSRRPTGAVVNICFRLFDAPTSIDDALQNLITSHDVPVIVATGQNTLPQESVDRYQFWPMRLDDTIRVGVTNNIDQRADILTYPNGFSCNSPTQFIYHLAGSSIFAPGFLAHTGTGGFFACGIRVASNLGGYNITKGTSGSAPMVTGVAAQLQSVNTTFHQR